jgi:type-F conjugative transfer system pilin assembly protein TrbC
MNFKQLTVVLATAVSCSFAAAQDSEAEAERERAEAEAALKASGPFLKDMSEEERKRAIVLGRGVVNDILDAYEQRMKTDKALVEYGNKQRKFADAIADEAIQSERDQALEFLGIDPNASTGLFIFVSWSMPLDMLRAYVLDAMWSGATIVFKGVPPGKSLGDFVMKDLRELVYGKTAAANISIDPRLFDAYEIKNVPTIVYTTVRGDFTCQGVNPIPFTYNNQQYTYDGCPPIDESSYWKLSGAVSTHYALQAFKDGGAPGVESHIKAMARGFAEGKAPAKEQLGFGGKWESVLSPEDIETVRRVVRETGATTSQLNATDGSEFRTKQGIRVDQPRMSPDLYRHKPEVDAAEKVLGSR